MSRIYMITYLLPRHRCKATTICPVIIIRNHPTLLQHPQPDLQALALETAWVSFPVTTSPKHSLHHFNLSMVYTLAKNEGEMSESSEEVLELLNKENCSRCVFGAWSTCRLCVKEQAHVLLPLPFDAPDSFHRLKLPLDPYMLCQNQALTQFPNQDGDTEADLPD